MFCPDNIVCGDPFFDCVILLHYSIESTLIHSSENLRYEKRLTYVTSRLAHLQRDIIL